MDQQFIQIIKERLEKERVRLEGELEKGAGDFDRGDGDAKVEFPNIGDEEEQNVLEVAEFDERLAANQTSEEQLVNVVAALQKIEQGSYGVCEKCGREILVARLDAFPAAATCVTCE